MLVFALTITRPEVTKLTAENRRNSQVNKLSPVEWSDRHTKTRPGVYSCARVSTLPLSESVIPEIAKI